MFAGLKELARLCGFGIKKEEQTINLIESLDEFKQDYKYIKNISEDAVDNIFKSKKLFKGRTYLPEKFPYFELTIFDFGKFSNYCVIVLCIKNVNKDVFFNLYRIFLKRSIIYSDSRLRDVINEFKYVLNEAINIHVPYFEEYKNSGIYTPHRERLFSYLYGKTRTKVNENEIIAQMLNPSCLFVPEYLLYAGYHKPFIIAGIKNNTVKTQIIKNNFAPLIEHFKIG